MSASIHTVRSEARREYFDALADLLAYPRPDVDAALVRAQHALDACLAHDGLLEPVARETFALFLAAAAGMSVGEREELYTRTFDVNPVATLDLGWHLYGEQYERGAFLVRMREALRRTAVEETTELPDHLTQALRALGRMEEDEAAAFTAAAVGPAVHKILAGFEGRTVEKEITINGLPRNEEDEMFVEHPEFKNSGNPGNPENPYIHLIRTIAASLPHVTLHPTDHVQR